MINSKSNHPLLIGGCPRSGTTALVQLLNSNPGVHISSEENLVNVDRVLTKLLGTRERREKVYKEKGTRALSERETLNVDNILASNFCEESVWPTIRHLYRWHHNKIHPDSPLALWGDKFPNYFKEIDAVLAIPNVRYLHITRNPFDVVNSMLRRTEMAKQGKDWWKSITNFDAMIEAWAEAYRIAQSIERRKNVLHLHYEELIFDFALSVEKINVFLQVELEFENIIISDSDKHHDRSFMRSDMFRRLLMNPDVDSYVAQHHDAPMMTSALQDICTIRQKVYPGVPTIRIFVGATPAEWLPMRVLEFSILEQTQQSVELSALYACNRPIVSPQAMENRPRTPFSFQRFLIPELCGFDGKAIYLDADMQVFQDISLLWNTELAGYDLQTVQDGNDGRRGQFSVMLLDCQKLGWNVDQIVADLDSGKLDYAALMYEMRVAKNIGRDISSDWNSLEHYEAGKTCLLHYTDMNTQPWISTANPLGHLWIACLKRALQSGFISRKDLEKEISSGHVRPSLLAQIDAGIDSSVSLPASLRRLDRDFVAPYRRLQTGKCRPWTSLRAAVSASLRRAYYRSPLPHYFNGK